MTTQSQISEKRLKIEVEIEREQEKRKSKRGSFSWLINNIGKIKIGKNPSGKETAWLMAEATTV